MQENTIYLRQAVSSDMDMLFQLANDEAVRKNSFHMSSISYEEHREWFQNMMADSSQHQFILMSCDQPVGQVRLSVHGSQAEINYSILPEKRGMGYGKAILQLVKDLVRQEYPDIEKLIGKVKPTNAASIFCFEEKGFVETYEQYEFDMKDYRKEPITAPNNYSEIRGGGILYLTNSKSALPLFRWIAQRSDARIFSDKLNIGVLERMKPKLVVSYNYRYIVSSECIDYLIGNIINLHISMLPWNRGASPNIWSFIDGTPKGVTIHQISPGLDEGDIFCQKELFFDPEKETFQTTYQKLTEEIVSLFQQNWADIDSGDFRFKTRKQTGCGSSHTVSDLKKLRNKIDFHWTDNIADFLGRYRALETEER